MSVTILGIESSCDDTSAAIIRDGFLLSNLISSQEVHKIYGGVVPELASRAHQANIIPVVDSALKKRVLKSTKLMLLHLLVGQDCWALCWWEPPLQKDLLLLAKSL
jgi:N6-L-threonylcarbamoyladenine synthase